MDPGVVRGKGRHWWPTLFGASNEKGIPWTAQGLVRVCGRCSRLMGSVMSCPGHVVRVLESSSADGRRACQRVRGSGSGTKAGR